MASCTGPTPRPSVDARERLRHPEKLVILSEAKGLLIAQNNRSFAFAQDDKWLKVWLV
jgi:hypothetical protein